MVHAICLSYVCDEFVNALRLFSVHSVHSDCGVQPFIARMTGRISWEILEVCSLQCSAVGEHSITEHVSSV